MGITVGKLYDPSSVQFLGAIQNRDFTIGKAINDLVVDLKNYALWDKMKAIYPMVGGNTVTHGYNLKNPIPVSSSFYMTFENNVLHSSLGIITNGGWGNTNFTPSQQPLDTNSGHLSLYNRTSDSSDGYDFGVRASTGSAIMLRGNTVYGGVNITNNISAAGNSTSINITNKQGFYVTSRINTLQTFTQYRTTDTITNSVTNTAVGLPTIPLLLGTTNGNSFFKTSRNYAFASIGDGLTDVDAINLYNIVQKYQTTLGRQV